MLHTRAHADFAIAATGLVASVMTQHRLGKAMPHHAKCNPPRSSSYAQPPTMNKMYHNRKAAKKVQRSQAGVSPAGCECVSINSHAMECLARVPQSLWQQPPCASKPLLLVYTANDGSHILRTLHQQRLLNKINKMMLPAPPLTSSNLQITLLCPSMPPGHTPSSDQTIARVADREQ